MTTLFLYVDCDNITAAYDDNGQICRINTGTDNGQLWLYFHEADSKISFGKQFRSQCLNGVPHYYGDVFNDLITAKKTFQIANVNLPIRKIFLLSGILETLKQIPNPANIDVYIAFAWDVPYPICDHIFNEILEEESVFKVKESGARLPQLALTYTNEKPKSADGFYLVLEALGDNLRYSVYQNKNSNFVGLKPEASILKGQGVDFRKKILTEQIVSQINTRQNYFREDELKDVIDNLLTTQGEDFIQQLDNSDDVAYFSNIQLNAYLSKHDATIRRSEVERTAKVLLECCIDTILSDLPQNVGKEALNGIVCIGDVFKNEMYTQVLQKKFSNTPLQTYSSDDVPNIVGAYRFIKDFGLFAEQRKWVKERSDEDLKAIQRKEEEQRFQAELDKRRDEELRFQLSMTAAQNAEQAGDYSVMIEHLEAALALKPNDATAKKKLSEAEKKLSELKQLEKKKTAAFFDSADKQKPPAKSAATEKPKSAPKSDYDFFNSDSTPAKQQAAATEKTKSDYDFFNSDSEPEKQETNTEKQRTTKKDFDFFN